MLLQTWFPTQKTLFPQFTPEQIQELLTILQRNKIQPHTVNQVSSFVGESSTHHNFSNDQLACKQSTHSSIESIW